MSVAAIVQEVVDGVEVIAVHITDHGVERPVMFDVWCYHCGDFVASCLEFETEANELAEGHRVADVHKVSGGGDASWPARLLTDASPSIGEPAPDIDALLFQADALKHDLALHPDRYLVWEVIGRLTVTVPEAVIDAISRTLSDESGTS